MEEEYKNSSDREMEGHRTGFNRKRGRDEDNDDDDQRERERERERIHFDSRDIEHGKRIANADPKNFGIRLINYGRISEKDLSVTPASMRELVPDAFTETVHRICKSHAEYLISGRGTSHATAIFPKSDGTFDERQLEEAVNELNVEPALRAYVGNMKVAQLATSQGRSVATTLSLL
jgi:hypothetical protein